LFDEFRLFAVQRVAASATKLVAVAVAFWVGANLWTFGLIWMAGEVLGYVLLATFGHRELWKHGYTQFWKSPFRDVLSENEGLWSYVWTTNLHGTVRMASLRLDTLIVGGYLGESAAGLYKVAKELGRVLSRFSQPLYKAIYPDLSRLWSQGDHRNFVRLVVRSGVLAGAGGILIWFGIVAFGDRILSLAAGPDYAVAYSVMVWYMLGVVVSVAAFPVTPAVLAMGAPRLPFYSVTAATLTYFSILFLCLEVWGLAGAGVSYLIFYITWILFLCGGAMMSTKTDFLGVIRASTD
jgi:O-antigen/teichoic acid export membrane protein